MTVRCLLPEDRVEVLDLLTTCFGSPKEAHLLDSLRDAGDIRLELVWMEGRHLRGDIPSVRHESPTGWQASPLT
ncbi:MAG: hypothetical protein P1U72_06510 [Paracoccaceae bacterium]|nr:hypothetical protein [Paracoccaceae bacterium]